MEKEIKVSTQHVWVGVEDQHVHLGLTNYLQGALGTVLSAFANFKTPATDRDG